MLLTELETESLALCTELLALFAELPALFVAALAAWLTTPRFSREEVSRLPVKFVGSNDTFT